jgi:hypothetical protein
MDKQVIKGNNECNGNKNKFFEEGQYVATSLWPSVRMKLTLPKLGTWSPPGLLNV